MQKKDATEALKEYMIANQPIYVQELYEYFRRNEPWLKESSLRWKIHKYAQEGIIYNKGKGMYYLQEKEMFSAEQTMKMQEIAKTIHRNLPYTKFTIYGMEWLNALTIHHLYFDYTIIEVEVDALEAVFQIVKEKYSNVFLAPDKNVFSHYIVPGENNIIINRLYVDAPLKKTKRGYYLPKLEKLLVDLYDENFLFPPLDRREADMILVAANRKYSLNITTLQRYMKKRYIDFDLENIIVEV